MEQVAQADPFITQDSFRLICGDCLTVLPALEAGTVDVVVTSPPYNLGLSYRDYCDRRNEDEYLDWLIRVASEIRRVMKADASFFLNISGSSSAPWLPFDSPAEAALTVLAGAGEYGPRFLSCGR